MVTTRPAPLTVNYCHRAARVRVDRLRLLPMVSSELIGRVNGEGYRVVSFCVRRTTAQNRGLSSPVQVADEGTHIRTSP